MKLRQAKKLVLAWTRPRYARCRHERLNKAWRIFYRRQAMCKVFTSDHRLKRYCREISKMLNSPALRAQMRQEIDNFFLYGSTAGPFQAQGQTPPRRNTHE